MRTHTDSPALLPGQHASPEGPVDLLPIYVMHHASAEHTGTASLLQECADGFALMAIEHPATDLGGLLSLKRRAFARQQRAAFGSEAAS